MPTPPAVLPRAAAAAPAATCATTPPGAARGAPADARATTPPPGAPADARATTPPGAAPGAPADAGGCAPVRDRVAAGTARIARLAAGTGAAVVGTATAVAVAVTATAALGVVAAPAAAQQAAPAPLAAPALVAPATALARRPTLLRGVLDPVRAGRVAEVQRLDARRGWLRVAAATVGADGSFAARWRPRVLGTVTLRLAVRRAGESAAAAAGAATTRTTVMRASRATWYGPGFYGRRTACGIRLTQDVMGVAHRRLPCGTPVTIALAGRTIVVPVIDRGPFANRATYDLTAAAAKALGMTVTTTLGTLPAPGARMAPPLATPDPGAAAGGTAFTG